MDHSSNLVLLCLLCLLDIAAAAELVRFPSHLATSTKFHQCKEASDLPSLSESHSIAILPMQIVARYGQES